MDLVSGRGGPEDGSPAHGAFGRAPRLTPGATAVDFAGARDEPEAAPSSVVVHTAKELPEHLPRLEAYLRSRGPAPLSRHPAWCLVLKHGLRQVPYCLEAAANGQTQGFLPVTYVSSLLFGRFLVGLPYLNYGGVVADDDESAGRLVDRAVRLADRLNVRYLQLRHEVAFEHPSFAYKSAAKVNMHRPLPTTASRLWDALPAKVRNQVRKGRKSGLNVVWGGEERLADFYEVFSHNMRDLGTPVYGRRLFASIVRQFPERAEFCVVRLGARPLAAALLLHGWGMTEVPSAGALRPWNSTCANMLMYWHLLERAVERRQTVFDFGRCTPGGNTYRFKKQWGAAPRPTEWQYYLRRGEVEEMSPYNPRYLRYVRWWQRLPLPVTRLAGPWIVRGIP